MDRGLTGTVVSECSDMIEHQLGLIQFDQRCLRLCSGHKSWQNSFNTWPIALAARECQILVRSRSWLLLVRTSPGPES